MMFDYTIQQLLLRFIGLLAIVGVHGVATASAAVALGDRGVAYDGKRTPNPLVHIDAMGALGSVLFSLGWIKPIAVERAALRRPALALVLIGLAGPVATLALVAALGALAPTVVTVLRGSARNTAFSLLTTTANLAVWFALFNLLPVPPLTGRYFLAATAPRLASHLQRHSWPFRVALALLVVSGVALPLLRPLQQTVLALLYGR